MYDLPLLSVEDKVAIGVVLTISACIGIYFRFAGDRQKSAKEFLMAGRSMSPFPVVFSLIVTFVSAVMMLGIPGEVYNFGLYRMIAYVFSTLSNVLSAYIFLPVYFQMGESVSVYEYLERRFGKLTRRCGSFMFILQQVFYMAVVLYAPALALKTVAHIPTNLSIPLIGGICTFYCCLGGLKAVLWTDVFQAIIMYICIFAVFTKGIMLAEDIPGSLVKLHSKDTHFFSFDPTERYTLWNCVLYGFLYGLCNYGCNQAQVQRMLSVKNLKLSQRAVIVSVPLAVLFIALNFFIGAVLYAYYHTKCIPLKNKDELVPYFIMEHLSKFPGLAGLCVAGIFSGSLSTISSSVNSLSAVTMEDFVRPYFGTGRKLTDGMVAFLVKAFAFGYGMIGIGFAFVVGDKGLIYAYTAAYGIISGPILGLFTLGMMTRTANEKGTLIGLLSGSVTTLTLGMTSYAIFMSNCRSSGLACVNKTSSSTFAISNSTLNDTNWVFLNDLNYNVFTETPSPVMNSSYSRTFNYYPDLSNGNISGNTSDSSSSKDCSSKKEFLSVMWLLIIGFVITTVVGYFASLITGKEKESEVDPCLLSPMARKWLMKPLPTSSDEPEELVKLKGTSGT